MQKYIAVICEGGKQMTQSLYVGNLPWSITEEELVAAFQDHAPVISARILTEKETGRSRGFGFIECEDEHADKLIKAMNGATLGNRQIVVNLARPKGNNFGK